MKTTAEQFVSYIKKISKKHWEQEVSDLLWRTCWTLQKWYDQEELYENMLSDTKEREAWKADYMNQ